MESRARLGASKGDEIGVIIVIFPIRVSFAEGGAGGREERVN